MKILRKKVKTNWKKPTISSLLQKIKTTKDKGEVELIRRKIRHIRDWKKANVTLITYYPERHKIK